MAITPVERSAGAGRNRTRHGGRSYARRGPRGETRHTGAAKMELSGQRVRVQRSYPAIKRALDLSFALVLLVLLLPLMLLIALCVCLDSPGPALYTQERIGRGGHRFRIYKF